MPFETCYICDTCQPPFSFYKITEEDPRKVKCRAPACPQCKERRAQAKTQMRVRGDVKSEARSEETREQNVQDWKDGKAPQIMTPSNHNKAIDQTAEIVMQDYNMTDIKMDTSLRAGDNCVPKLSHELERKVDAVFDNKAKNNVMGMAGDKLTSSLMNQINAGAFRSYGDPVARQQADPSLRPKTNVMYHHDDRGKPN